MESRAINMQLLLGLIAFVTITYADEIILNVNTKKPIAVTSEKFLSLTIDPVTLLRGDLLTNDFERSSKILKALAPAYLRLAGPQCNFYTLSTYSQQNQADSDNPFTEEHWTALQRWAEGSALNVISSITPQYADSEALEDPVNAGKVFDLFSFSDRMQYNTSWQIGYECQTRCDLSGADLGKYVTRLRNKLDSFPRYSNSIIVGPDIVTYRSRQQQLYLQDYLTTAYPALSAITWHPNFAGVTLSGNGVTIHQDDLATDKEELYKVINQAAGKKPLWIAESKKEECKDQFLGALLWMRRLGNAAKIGAQVLMRNPRNPSQATPDYWVSLLHKTLVGREVLEVKTQAGNNSHVHFYGQCTKPSEIYEKGALTVFAVNLTPAKVTASLKGTRVKPLHEYILQPGFDTYNRMFAKTVLLNNKPLRLTKDGDVPNLIPLIKTGTKGGDFELPAGGIGFWVIPDAKIKSCMEHEDQSSEKVLRKASKQLEEHGRVGNGQGLDDVSEKGKTNEVTDERRRQRKKFQKHEEDEYEEKKSKKNDLQKYLEVLAKVLRRKLGGQEEKKPLILNGSYTLFAPNNETKENVEPNKNVRFEKIKAMLEEYKKDFSTTNGNADAKTTTQALDLISKIENGIETLERGTDIVAGMENPEEKLVTSEKLENINAQVKNHLEQLYRLLPEKQNEGKILNDANVSYNSSEFKAVPAKDTSARSRRDVDNKFAEESLSFRRDNSLKKRGRNDETKDRRNDRQNRKKETVRREGITPYYDPIRSDSNENNFHGFWRQEPLKTFPQGDIYLATGDSSEESHKDYEYVEDEEVPADEEGNAKVKTLLVDYTEPDDTWVGDGSDHLGYVPNEFYEIVNIPNVHTKENLKDYGELWEAESLQKLQEGEQVPRKDAREVKIIPERRLTEEEENQTKQRTAEKLMEYYENVRDSQDDDALHVESKSDLRHLESEEISPRLLNRNIPIYVTRKNSHDDVQIPIVKSGRNVQGASRKVKSMLGNGDDEQIDFNSMHFTRELPPSRESQGHERHYSRRHKRKIDKLDDIFRQEMIAQDDNNLKDCECRVTRYNRLKRSVADVEINEKIVVDEKEEEHQTEDSSSSAKTDYANGTRSAEILENTESSKLTLSAIDKSDRKELVDESKINAKIKREPGKDGTEKEVIQEVPERRLQGATTVSDFPEERSIILAESSSHQISSGIEMPPRNASQEESVEFFRGNVKQSKEQVSPVNLIYHRENTSENREVVEPSIVEKTFRNKKETIEGSPENQKSSTFRKNEETGAKATLKKRQSSTETLMTNSSAEVKVDAESPNEEVELNREPSTDQKAQQQTGKPAKRFVETKTSPTTSRNAASRRSSTKSTDSSAKGKTKISQRAEELARIIESRLAARAEALEALKRENERRERKLTDRSTKNPPNDSTRLQDSQRKRSELLDKLKEKLTARRERILQTYRDELQRALERTSDEGKKNIKRREIWEKFTESDNYKGMVDAEKLAYVLTYKPVDYKVVSTERKVDNDVDDKKYVSVTEITRPLHQVREKLVNLKSSPQISYDPNIMSYTNYDLLGRVKYPSIDEIIKSEDDVRNSERGSGKVYYSIVENFDEPRIFEYQPRADQGQEENIALSVEQQSDKIRPPHITYNTQGKNVNPNVVEQYRNVHYLIRPEQDTQTPSEDQQLFRVTPTLLQPSRKESCYSKSGSTSKNQEVNEYQIVYRLNKLEQKSQVPVKEQNLKITSYVPKSSGNDYTNDKFKNLFSPEERMQIIRLLTNIEDKPHIPVAQPKHAEELPRMINGKDHIPRVLQSFFTPEELKKYQIIQSSSTPILRQKSIKISAPAQSMDENVVVYSLPESIALTEDAEIYEDADSNSEEDSEEYSQGDSSGGRRVYVIDPSAYRGGDPILQLHEDEIEKTTSTSQEISEPENLYRVLWDVHSNKPYEIIEQTSIKQKSNVQDFPVTRKLPNDESCKETVLITTNEKERDDGTNNAPISYILEETKPNDETKEVTRKYSESLSCTVGRRDTQHINKTDEADASVQEISENGAGSQLINDNTETGYIDHHSINDKKVVTDDEVSDQTKEASVLDTIDDCAEKKKRTAVSENISQEGEIADEIVEEETKSTENHSVEENNNPEILAKRKKRALRNRVKDDSLERMYPIISAQKTNQLERNTKTVNNKNSGFNENFIGNVHKKEKIFQLVQPDAYYKTLPLEVAKISDRSRLNKQNIDKRVQEKRVSPVYPDFLSRNAKYQLQHNRNRLEDRDTNSKKIIEVVIPPKSQGEGVISNIKVVDQSNESVEFYSDSSDESSSSKHSADRGSLNSRPARQQAVLINIPDEHENGDEFETVLEDADQIRYRGKKLTANEFPHLYDILKADNGNKQGLMMLLPLGNSKNSRHRREIVIESNEPGKSQVLPKDMNLMNINEDTKDVTTNKFIEEGNTQNEGNDNENIRESITRLREEDQLAPKYIIEKNRLLKEFEETRRNKKHTSSSQQTEQINQNNDPNIKTVKYETPVKDTDSSFADINENSIDANFKNDRPIHTQNSYEKIEGLSTYLENGIPKVEDAIEMGLEKVKNFTGSVEHFIEDFDEKFNETLSPDERIKPHENESTSTPAQSVFNSAIINVKKIFTFFTGIMRLLHT